MRSASAIRRAPAVLILVALAVVASVWVNAPARAADAARPVVIQNELPVHNLGDHISFYRDTGGKVDFDEALRLYRSGRFIRSQKGSFDAGYTVLPHWIVIEVESRMPVDTTALLATNMPYVPAIDMYWVPDGGQRRIIQRKTMDTPYEQFVIKAGSRGKLVVWFKPRGIGLLPLSLESPESMFTRTSTESIGFTAFYVFALSMLALFIVFNLVLDGRGLGYFVLLFGSGLLLIFQIDGFPNAYFWPNYPRWNLSASCPMLFVLNFAALLVAAHMLGEGGHPRLSRWIRRLSPLALAPLLATLVVPVVWVTVVGLVLLPVSMGLLFYAVFTWARDLRAQRFVAILSGVGILAGVGIYMFYTFTGDAAITGANHRMLKVLYALGSVSIMASYATHAAALNRNYRIALQREVEAARRDAELSRSLLITERNFNRARDLANLRGRQLAAAAHDLRQPVASLRLMMDSFARNSEPAVRTNLARAFDYLESLVNDNLNAVRPRDNGGKGIDGDLEFEAGDDDNLPDNGVETETATERECFSVDIILQASASVYREEAISKQIELRVVASTVQVQANTLAAMRIVSNLVSNAVKHTERGRVLIGVRRSPEHAWLHVIDTGKGMTAEQLALFRTAYAKGEKSDGEGLGLAICFDLARDHGLILDVTSQPGKGTHFTLKLPRQVDRRQVDQRQGDQP
jgi:signal transduction histidine kinase